MAILSLISQSSFDPEMIETLAAAFDVAWERIKASGSPLAADEAADATRESLARAIIAAAQMGEHEQNRLVETALANVTRAAAGRRPQATDGS